MAGSYDNMITVWGTHAMPTGGNRSEILNVQHLPHSFGTGYDLWPLRISDSLRVSVASWQNESS